VDNRVQDLDQIQERDGGDRGRSAGSILLAALSLVGLTFAIGVVVGRAAEPTAQPEDPLAKLQPPAHATATQPSLATDKVAAPKVEAADLSFPSTLAEDEDRPEVLAALQAAAAEEAALADKPAVVDNADDQPDERADERTEAEAEAEPEPSAEQATEELVASVPAAVAAGSGARSLPRAAKHDPLVAAAIRSEDDVVPAPRGHDGEFTLQVISYDSVEPSRAFANGLREKGHEAYVVSADIPGRGRYYRVRIGPFKGRQQAEAYRHKFEADEHMNTFVVREKPEA